jgi:hypothetical protein
VDYMDDDEEVTVYWMLFSYKMAKLSYITLIMQCHVASSDLSEQSVVVDLCISNPCLFSPSTEWRGQPHHSEVVGAELGQPLGDVWLLGALPHHPLDVWGSGSERELGTERHIEKGSNNKRELTWAC